MFETLLSVGGWIAAASTGISASAFAVNWVRYARSEYATFSGLSFLKHCYHKYLHGPKEMRSGYRGEYETARQLEKVKGNKKLLFNVLLPKGIDETTEIDILMIHETGIYVFENKNYSGTVGTVVTKGKKVQLGNLSVDGLWGVSNFNKIYPFGNPVRQNETHVCVIRRLLSGFKVGPQHFFSFVSFNDNAVLKGGPMKFHTSVDVHVGLTKNLAFDLNRQIPQRSKIITPDKMESVYSLLSQYSNVSSKERQAHIDRVSQKKQNYFQEEKKETIFVPSHVSLDTKINVAAEQRSKQPVANHNKHERMSSYLNTIRRD